ncbi:moesin/ezrin/radixin homolog 1 isoform X1 [Leptinotarsa decemlineata]|uniref:moesin/ezrin/radixin homolog 1 isoform X1 n=1 Tax=Leptinotarsa decemlineata TaxID=7539 RepID=UPI000C2523BA|nr:moesin/ezrin/radixin homolog 1-like [Leptinotarsa decemlineata]
MKVVVRTVLHESDLEAVPRTSIREIFSLISKSLGIQEVWYFGLMYYGHDAEEIWVEQSKKALKDLKNHSTNLHYKVKYYPEDIGEELIESITIEFFFLQVKLCILSDEIYCPADTCVLLASYALQVKYGDYSPDTHNKDILQKQKLLPDRLRTQFSMGATEWNKNIENMWVKHKGLDKEEAMLEYLKLVQNLEMYGVTYFNITNKKGTNLLLGVTALGLNIYKTEDRLNPTVSFPWSEIKNLKFKDRKFIIKPTDKTAKDFVIFTSSGRMSKYVLNLGVGNHSLYVRRRKPDSPDIVKMKEKANEIKHNRNLQKKKYYNEKTLREEAEQREVEYKKQIQHMKEEMEKDQKRLYEANLTIKRLQEQLEDLQKSKEELEQQRNELSAMMERLEQSKNMEAAERQKLEEEIRSKHEEVQKIQEEVERRDAEAKRLQEEVEEARRKEEELRRQAEEALRREEEERQRKLEQEELETLPDDADTSLPELQQVNDQLKEQLKLLQSKLEETRQQEQESDLDRIHRINLLEGRDKYKTLADIRRGNTVRRVEMFENM